MTNETTTKFEGNLAAALKTERLSAYARLRGGFPVPLAGATYWAVLAIAGHMLAPSIWYWVALFGSGTIFPLALLYANIFKNNFIKDSTAATSVIGPAFIGMLLFWPIAIAALWRATDLFPLVLAIGMSLHWPVIGWSYGRTTIFSAHAIIRALVSFYIWWKIPEMQLVYIPAAIAGIYLLTVMVIIIDSSAVKARIEKP